MVKNGTHYLVDSGVGKGVCSRVLLWERQFKKVLNSYAVWKGRDVNGRHLCFSEQFISIVGKLTLMHQKGSVNICCL